MATPCPPPSARALPAPSGPGIARCSRRALGGAARFAATILVGATLAGCARPETDPLSREEFAREQTAREAIRRTIDEDRDALVALISSDRFADPAAVYADAELRAIAEHLIEQSRKLGRIADSDVLAPGEP